MSLPAVFAVVVTAVACSTLCARPESERLLASSHVAVVTVMEEVVGRGAWEDVQLKVYRGIKGDWTAMSGEPSPKVSLHVPKDAVVKEGSKYLIFCAENATRYRGFRIHGYWENVFPVDDAEAKDVSTRLSNLARCQREELETALAAASRQRRSDGEVARLLALLFDRDTQHEAVTKLIALPAAADRELVMFVHDTRPIPRALLSPDVPITFHQSPVADCESIQDAVVWLLGLRKAQSFGSLTEASSARRTAVANAWFYWLVVRDGAPWPADR